MTNFGTIFASFLLLQLNLANFLVLGDETPMPVAFSTKYGGLTGTIGFGQKRSDMSENWFENVMLSTTNTRTFLVNGGTPNECFVWRTFCKLHPVRYDPVKAGTTTTMSYFVGKLTQSGMIVQDNILLPQYKDRPLMHKIGLMNEKVDNDPEFWGTETNLASGCLSLMPGVPKEIQNFGEKTPLQEFVDQFPLESFISIRLEKFDESNPKYYTVQSSVPGSFSIGRMPTIDQKCIENGNEWNNVKVKDGNVPWTFQIDGVEVDGTHWAQKRMALIDSGSENILLPKNAWTILKDKFALSDGKCNWQLPILKFHINSFVYFVPPQHYLRKESESSNNCALLLGPNIERENEFRLGLPFLRSACVGLDLRTQEVWLSENKPAPIVNGANLQNLSMAIKIVAIGTIFLQIFTKLF